MGFQAPWPHFRLIGSTCSHQGPVEPVVIGDGGSAWHPNLKENQPANIFGMLFQQTVDGLQPVGDSLGVIDPVDADAQNLGNVSQLLLPLAPCRSQLPYRQPSSHARQNQC